MDYQRFWKPLDFSARASRLRAVSSLALCFLFLIASSAVATPINYGDFSDIPPGSVMYLDVTESSSTDTPPLYGAPSISGNVLDFDPTGFGANSAGGGGDVTDGQLNFDLMGHGGAAFTGLRITEGGDYTLAGRSFAQVGYGIGLRVTVVEIDGVAVGSPFDLVGDASGTKSLPGGAGISLPWGLSLNYDLNAALIGEGFTQGSVFKKGSKNFARGITKAEVAIDDTLLALSDNGSVAFIAKKNFTIETFDVPEPTTALLALMAFGAVAMKRR